MKKSRSEQMSMLGPDGEALDVNKIITKSIDEIMHESMMPYSECVILDRALPRVEDGLKPVQRRILYTMLELGLSPDKPFRKSARIVGDCLGKYHPHGDTSVYDAMVRMAQTFNMREPLVTGHGNFGSVDGDSAAAMRYTEAKMSPLALEMLKDLEKNTVSWSFNFDDSLKEPDMLPAGFPNLLVNGSTGIAVGLATNIPTHNLAEVIDGAVAMIDKPKITLDEMMKYIPAPDFPTGGYVIVGDELKQAYATGKGKVIMRAKINIETNDDRKSIIITELPFQVNKALLLQKIAELKEDKGKTALAGIQEIRDESDRKGMRAVIKLKKDVAPEPIINYLLKYSNLQTQFNINMVAIAEGKPQQLGLLDLVRHYINFRQKVIVNRTKFDLEVAKERAHILEGLLIAIKNIDAVVKIIKTSSSTTEAKQRLREKFLLSEKQAQAILDMRLSKLTNLEVNKLEKELADLKVKIAELTAILNSTKLQLKVVKDELLAVKRQFKNERKSKILNKDKVEIPSDEDLKVARDVVVGITAMNTIKAIPVKNFSMSQKEFGTNSTLYEAHSQFVKCTTEQSIFVFTNLGNCYKVNVGDIDEAKFKDKGTPLKNLLECSTDEVAVYIMLVPKSYKDRCLYIFTEEGMVKKSKLAEYNVSKSLIQAIKLKEGDKVIGVCEEGVDDDRMVLVTKGGMVSICEISDIPDTGRVTNGVKAIKLNDGDKVILGQLSDGSGEIVTITSKANAKRTIIAEYDVTPRYRKGLKLISFGKDGEYLQFASIVTWPYTIVVEDINGITISKYTEDIAIANHGTSGKNMVRSKNGLVVSRVAIFKEN